jgi:hypothetical protein
VRSPAELGGFNYQIKQWLLLGLSKPREHHEVHMSEEDLELLITLDDPWDAQEEDTFNHLQAEHIVAWPGQPFPAMERHDHRAEAVIDNGPYTMVFGQGD